jgi:uncharacterized protein (DUF2252 family)
MVGKSLRKETPRSAHGFWQLGADRPDPIALLQAQDEGRLPHLLPIKYGRMVASPFAFLRGSAVVMAADLAHTPMTGLKTQLCGDAHLSNFGLFASRERTLVFDVNDFDETYPGSWEWDLKRLAASAVVAGRENGFSEKVCRKAALLVGEAYRKVMARFAEVPALDIWYYYVEAGDVEKIFAHYASKKGQKQTAKMVSKARTKTHEHSLQKLTQLVEGRREFISDPPLVVPIRGENIHTFVEDDLVEKLTLEAVAKTLRGYLDSLENDRRQLLSHYRLRDIALRVGGVGSVGTRCMVVLLEGGAEEDALILQLKEAGPSVLEPYQDAMPPESHAQRVVEGQRLMQATPDIFLGWHESELTGRHFYWRQFKDMKGSADVAAMDKTTFGSYLGVCSTCLARAHARAGDPSGIAGYLGKGDRFDEALADFAVAYADQTERDHQSLVDAVKSGRVTAETGI